MDEKIINTLPVPVRIVRTIFGPGNEYSANPNADIFGKKLALLSRAQYRLLPTDTQRYLAYDAAIRSQQRVVRDEFPDIDNI